MEIFNLPSDSDSDHFVKPNKNQKKISISTNKSNKNQDHTKSPWLKWDHIHPMVLQSLLENEFEKPTEVQSYTLSTFKHYNDFIIASHTGSGKTLSFGIPMLSEILFDKQGSFDKSNNYLRGLVVAPTRELALQIEKHMKAINKNTSKIVTIISLVGGISKEKQKRLLGYKPDIIIATPGRLWDFMEEDAHPYLQELNKINYFIMDEADRMIEMGHFDDLDKILSSIFQKTVKSQDRKIIDEILEKTRDTETIKDEDKLMEGEILELDGEEFLKQQKFNKGYAVQEMILENKKEEPKNKKNKGKRYQKNQNSKEDENEEKIENEDNQNEEDQEKSEKKEGFLNLDKNLLKDIKITEDDLIEDEGEEGEEDELEGEELEGEELEGEELEGEEQLEQEEENSIASEDDIEEYSQQEGEDGEEGEDVEEEFAEAADLENDDEEKKFQLEQLKKKFQVQQTKPETEAEQVQNLPKKNHKMKIFLVSATILQHFKGKTKFKITPKELKNNKKKAIKENNNEKLTQEQKDEQFNIKIQALLSKIKFSGKPKIVDLTSKTLFPEKLKEFKSVLEEEDKILYLYHYLQQNPDQNFIIFCNSITYAKKVTHLLEVLKYNPVMLHSEMQQRQRLKKLDKFKERKSNILVCTDVAARGLDIPSVENVIHYQVPMDIDTYVHRSGRTARIGQEGTSYVFIGPQDGKRYNQLCKQLNKSEGLQGLEITVKEQEKIKQLIDEAVSYEKKQYQLKKKQQENVWYQKISKDAEIVLDDQIQQEMSQVQDEIQKKRIITNDQKKKYDQVSKQVKNIDRSRRNALFLDPNQIHEYYCKIQNIKQKVKEDKENKELKKNNKQNNMQKHNKNNRVKKAHVDENDNNITVQKVNKKKQKIIRKKFTKQKKNKQMQSNNDE
ncbi:P-loop containing nucleoside triphosphate hydrolase [Pseudocohnilembus persalinus]|uniref:ATP-dependent RNA helicase n=1 Tax=Pseudocohnilembus persalinus TaxID=266149 RepID=A0A0V0QZS6_PSEPJ|nr:P-loop containing nucleoside triphosphate hydrolase [Pseudocohnilembus persalinus]|eukprot:KRX07546.1 P-loop containing nucleoside triphosphate hydrolase [Pseudocohnilembus persalinus]